MDLTPETAVRGRYSLKAECLEGCPLHCAGDRLMVDPPAVLPTFLPQCMIPLHKACTLPLNKTGIIQCRWKNCQGTWLVSPAAEPDASQLSDRDDARPFLLQLPSEAATELIRAGEELSFSNGEVILEADSTNQNLFLMREGEVETLERRDGTNLRVGLIHRGECFGETSLLARQPVSKTVRAMKDVKVISISRDRLVPILCRHPILSVLFMRLLARRLHASNLQLEHILRPGLWGKLEIFPITSVVESIYQSRMTGCLTITRSRLRIQLFFDEGRMNYAGCVEVRKLVGEDALLEALSWTEGVFRFLDDDGQVPAANLSGNTMAIMLDAVRRYDERVRNEEAEPDTSICGDGDVESAQADSMQTIVDSDEVSRTEDEDS